MNFFNYQNLLNLIKYNMFLIVFSIPIRANLAKQEHLYKKFGKEAYG